MEDKDIEPTTSDTIQSIGAQAAVPMVVERFPVPALVQSSGPAATFACEEFLYGKIRNPNTRAAYGHAVQQFLAHCEQLGRELHQVTPRDVGCYLDDLSNAPATKKLHLSAIRHFFDLLVTRHVIVLNPALSVRSERLQVIEGKTPEISVANARKLLLHIDPSTLVGQRDRAIVAILIYTAVRVGARGKARIGGPGNAARIDERVLRSRALSQKLHQPLHSWREIYHARFVSFLFSLVFCKHLRINKWV